MRRDHRLSRRLFLSELGRRTVAVAVLGSGVAACSSDSSDPEAPAAGATTTEQQTTSSAATEGTSGQTDDQPDDQQPAGSALRWERADFGFVSAYVLARGDEVAIVDTGTDGSGGQIEQALGALSLGWADVDHVILTHAHGDHIGGLEAVLTAAPSAVGYAGAGDIDQISAPRDLTSVTGGEEVFGLQIIATPGHTPGHISTYDPDTGLLVAGDAMVTENGALAGPVDQFTDDLDLAHESVKKLAVSEVATILVGHGDPITSGAGGQLRDLAASL